MKYILRIICILFSTQAVFVKANVIFDLYGSNGAPSELAQLLDNQTGPLNYTNSGIIATFSTPSETMNRTNGGFGIDTAGSGDTSYALDFSEALDIVFNQRVTITALDFRNFDDGESINIIIGSTIHTLTWADLDNQSSDYKGNLTWDVPYGKTMRFEVAGSGDTIAIDSLTVIPEPATITLLLASGLATLLVRRRFS